MSVEPERKRRKWDVADPAGVPDATPVYSMTSMFQPAKTNVSTITPPIPVKTQLNAEAIKRAQEAAAAVVNRLNNEALAKGGPASRLGVVEGKSSDVFREVYINDAPTVVRHHLTKKATQDEIQRKTRTVIVTRGRYYPAGTPVDGNEKPLHLRVTASTDAGPTPQLKEYAVSNAAAEIQRILQGERQSGGSAAGAGSASSAAQSGQHTSSIMIGFEAPPEFGLSDRILGPGGTFLSHIASQTGSSVVLKGRGSGAYEGPEPLHLLLTAQTSQALSDAYRLASDLVQTVRTEYQRMHPSVPTPPAAPALSMPMATGYQTAYPGMYPQPAMHPTQPPTYPPMHPHAMTPMAPQAYRPPMPTSLAASAAPLSSMLSSMPNQLPSSMMLRPYMQQAGAPTYSAGPHPTLNPTMPQPAFPQPAFSQPTFPQSTHMQPTMSSFQSATPTLYPQQALPFGTPYTATIPGSTTAAAPYPGMSTSRPDMQAAAAAAAQAAPPQTSAAPTTASAVSAYPPAQLTNPYQPYQQGAAAAAAMGAAAGQTANSVAWPNGPGVPQFTGIIGHQQQPAYTASGAMYPAPTAATAATSSAMYSAPASGGMYPAPASGGMYPAPASGGMFSALTAATATSNAMYSTPAAMPASSATYAAPTGGTTPNAMYAAPAAAALRPATASDAMYPAPNGSNNFAANYPAPAATAATSAPMYTGPTAAATTSAGMYPAPTAASNAAAMQPGPMAATAMSAPMYAAPPAATATSAGMYAMPSAVPLSVATYPAPTTATAGGFAFPAGPHANATNSAYGANPGFGAAGQAANMALGSATAYNGSGFGAGAGYPAGAVPGAYQAPTGMMGNQMMLQPAATAQQQTEPPKRKFREFKEAPPASQAVNTFVGGGQTMSLYAQQFSALGMMAPPQAQAQQQQAPQPGSVTVNTGIAGGLVDYDGDD